MGSSPLTRGKPLRVREARKHQGLIPAHAGKTLDPASWCGRTWAHPRSRGENAELARALRNLAGSSPLTRGKRNQELIKATGAGLIPAHAGKTVSVAEVIRPMGAHPRSRGENYPAARSHRQNLGSSPLTRGKQNHLSNRIKPCGLIPAHAGKTMVVLPGRRAFRAHPRSRGENSVSGPPACAARGSSPLTRGKLCTLAYKHKRVRLIPAHAGKTEFHGS